MNPSKLISRVAIVAFTLAAALSFTEVIDPTVDPNDNVRRLGFLAAGVAFGVMAAIVWFVKKYQGHLTRSVLLVLMILYLPIFSANILITWQDSIDPELEKIEKRAEAAAALGLPFDKREYVNALLDIRSERPSVFQNTSPKEFVTQAYCESTLDIDGVKTVPMGALASTPTLISNELGTYPIWMTDRYGFNNPDSIWNDTSLLDSIIIGDSFAAGYSVQQGEEITGQLRKSDHISLNLASFGAGPLTALAQLREYGRSISPDYVFWIFYHGNDFADLNHELKHPVINQYLDPSFSQNLRPNSGNIDPVYRKYVENVLATFGKTRKGPGCAEFRPVTDLRRKIGGFASLITLKNSASRVVANMRSSAVISGNIAEFDSIAKLIDDEARQSGAQLVFVFLPQYWDLLKEERPSEIGGPLVTKDKILEIITSAGIPAIDIQDTLNAHSDPASFYPLRMFGHMSPFGYERVATALNQYALENHR